MSDSYQSYIQEGSLESETIHPPKHYTEEEFETFRLLDAKVVINPNSPSDRYTVRLNMSHSFGRAPSNDTIIEDRIVSKLHGIIFFFKGSLYFRDNESRNGSFLLSDIPPVRIRHSKRLFNDDTVRMGETFLKILFNDIDIQRTRDIDHYPDQSRMLWLCCDEDHLSQECLKDIPFDINQWSFKNVPFGVDARDDSLSYIKRFKVVIVSFGFDFQDHECLNDPYNDFRILLQSALQACLVIPVLFDDIALPSLELLPDELKSLNYRQKFHLKNDLSNLKDLVDISNEISTGLHAKSQEGSYSQTSLHHASTVQRLNDERQKITGPLTFLSFASQDQTTVEVLYNTLNDNGVAVWCSSYDIKDGDNWDTTIQKALDVASHVILVASANAIQSRHVRSEIEYALSNGKVVMPIIVDESPLPMGWAMLQSTKLDGITSANKNEDEHLSKSLVKELLDEHLKKFMEDLPKRSVLKLKNLIAQRAPLSAIKELLISHPYLIIDADGLKSRPDEIFDITFIPKEGREDSFFIGDTVSFLIMDPHSSPFDEGGELHLDIVKRLSLKRIEGADERDGWVNFIGPWFIPDPGSMRAFELKVSPKVILMGQRDLCSELITKEIREEWAQVNVKFMSYNRIFDRSGL